MRQATTFAIGAVVVVALGGRFGWTFGLIEHHLQFLRPIHNESHRRMDELNRHTFVARDSDKDFYRSSFNPISNSLRARSVS